MQPSPNSICLCLLYLFTLHSSSADLASEHSFFASLDEDQNVKLYWNVNFAKKEIFFTVEAKTTGWIGFGISSGQGRMEGADIVIGWVKDGKPYFKDRHADGHVMPKIDSQQDYELISLKEDNGKTTMKFKRKFDTCDPQDNKIETGTTKVIYAYHPDDPTSENAIPQHSPTNRGPRSVHLLTSVGKQTTLPPDTKHFDLRQNKTAISKDGTSYVCKVFEMPKLNETHHIVKIEPVIQAGHEGVVHHMLLYECSYDFPDDHLNYTGDCYGSNMPPPIKACSGVSAIAGWAIGGKEFLYPEHVGFAIGKADSPKVVILEMHYDNPNNVEGMIDSSGMRFYYTKQLRKYEAGMLFIGAAVTTSLMIPPNQVDWETTGFCSADCTREALKGSKLPGKGINIFASMLHTHLAGQKALTRHVRDGVELPEISRDDHYDFNFQEYHILKKEVRVAPGDSLINVCIYNTKDRILPTFGGLRTYDEMCVSFLMYYPKVNLTRCVSAEWPAVQDWAKTFHVKNASVAFNPNFWTEAVNKGLKEAYHRSDKAYAYCSGRNNQPLPGLNHKLTPKPVIKIAYKGEPSCEAESMGHRAVPGYLGLLISLLYLPAFNI